MGGGAMNPGVDEVSQGCSAFKANGQVVMRVVGMQMQQQQAAAAALKGHRSIEACAFFSVCCGLHKRAALAAFWGHLHAMITLNNCDSLSETTDMKTQKN